jgi:hypothetical protein
MDRSVHVYSGATFSNNSGFRRRGHLPTTTDTLIKEDENFRIMKAVIFKEKTDIPPQPPC